MGLFGGSFGGFFGGGFSGFFGGNSSGSGSSGGFNTKTNIVMDEKKIFKELKEIANKVSINSLSCEFGIMESVKML